MNDRIPYSGVVSSARPVANTLQALDTHGGVLLGKLIRCAVSCVVAGCVHTGNTTRKLPPEALVQSSTAGPHSANTVHASSCAFHAVRDAAARTKPGQTLAIPAGECDWEDNQLSIEAGIAITGAGRDATIVRRTVAVPANTYLVRINCKTGGNARVADITLVGSKLASSKDQGLGLLNGCVDFSVSNARFKHFVFAGIQVRGGARQQGVIYRNEFIDNYHSTVRNLGYGIVVYGDGTWPALELGSEHAVYVEDNLFQGNRHHIASNNGARYVFRHNTGIANTLTKDFPQVDAHGLSSSPRGTRSWEIYNNTFMAYLDAGRNVAGIGVRGGDGVIYRNTYSSNIAYPVLLLLEKAPCGSYPVQDQIRQVYILEEAPNTVFNKCPASIVRGRDYFFELPPDYRPYTYPHPLRSR